MTDEEAEKMGRSGFPAGSLQDKMYYNGIGGSEILGRYSEKEQRSIPLDECVAHGVMTQEEYDHYIEWNRKVQSGEFAREAYPELFE